MDQQEKTRKALDRAFFYLSKQDRSANQVRRFLAKKDFDEQTVEAVIDRLEELGYLNDERYAQRLVEANIGAKSSAKAAAKQKLLQSGIGREMAEKALSGVDAQKELEIVDNVDNFVDLSTKIRP